MYVCLIFFFFFDQGSIVNKHDEEKVESENEGDAKNKQYIEEKLRHRLVSFWMFFIF